LLVADNLSDDVLLLDPDDGRVIHSFDLSAHDFVPAEFPLNVVASRDGKRGWVSLWNGSAVGELDLDSGQVVRRVALLPPPSPTDPGSHPSALLLSRDEKWLYCTLSNADAVAVIESASGRIVRWVSTRLPKQRRPGVYPVALAQSPDGRRLYVADAAANAVEVFNAGRGDRLRRRGFIPTEWYPTSVVTTAADLVIISAKGQGTGPNSGVVKTTEGRIARSNHPYIFSLLGGSVARIKVAEAEPHLADLTRQVLESNRMHAQPAPRPWRKNPIRHVIYVIMENRSYDQVFGDIKEANGDSALVMYGEEITPNHHKLARQFGVLDNFYVSGEVSGDGHVWSTAAIGSDYTEATIQINYRNGQRTYDYEGTNLDEVVLERGVPDVNEPGTSYLWTNAARRRVSYRDYGELIEGKWCNAASATPEECPEKIIEKGKPLPPNVGQPHGSPSPYPWKVPVLGSSIATKKELRDHFDAKYAGWELDYPDQLRIDEFLNEFDGFVRAREQASSGRMPALIVLRLPNDHTSGTRVWAPKPEAQVADNDLALGRLVEAVSHSPYWDDTAILVLEDDAQNGPDHVDAHRSPAFVISKYSRRSQAGPYVDSHFYTTVNMIRTVEDLVGLPPMNHNDAQAAPMWTMLSADGSQPPYSADWRNRDNGLIYQVNASNAPGAAASAQLDFSHADAADAALLNEILWRAAKGEAAMPMSEHRNDIGNPARKR
jgi:DNA-binding beta-propeller fold protein YncE